MNLVPHLSSRRSLTVAIVISGIVPPLAATIGFLIHPRSALPAGPLASSYRVATITVVAAAIIAGQWVAYHHLSALGRRIAELIRLTNGAVDAENATATAIRARGDDLQHVIGTYQSLLSQLSESKRALQAARHELSTRELEHSREQTRFQSIFDNAPVGFSWMESGRVETRIVNPAHVKITGIAAEHQGELHRYREATHPDDRTPQDALHARLIAGEIDHYNIEKRYVHADGTIRWAALTVRHCRAAENEPPQEINTLIDITERRRAEFDLVKASRLLDTMMENTPDFIYFKDLESRFVRYSRAFLTRFNLSGLDALAGKTDFDLFTPEHAKPAFDDEQEIIRTGRPMLSKLEKETAMDGSISWVMTTKLPWRDEYGQIIGTFGISKDVTPLKEAESKLAETHQHLLEVSRHAGMAEIATGVLHNVGNVLNSVNVSATLVTDQVRSSKAVNMGKLAAMFAQNKANLGDFLAKDPRGQLIPAYIESLAEALTSERLTALEELENLRKNVNHIKDIVAMQQTYARTSGVIETVSLPELTEDALHINAGSLSRHDVTTVREYEARGVVTTDKHKVVQIIINLVRNAKYACDESGKPEKLITVRTTANERGVQIAVIDNGVGIPTENLTRIFTHGFTTRKNGHGFGLHSAALAAKELGGSLTVRSDGPGKGATFILELPRSRTESNDHERNS